jgi:Xaa-Pro aminopeptidase
MNAISHGWGRVSWDWSDREEWLDLPFPQEEYLRRTNAVKKVAEQHGLEAVVVVGDASDKGTVRYLSNFEVLFGGHAVVVVFPSGDQPALISNSIMHGEPMHSGFWMTWIHDARAVTSPRTGGKPGGLWEELVSLLNERKSARRVGVAGHGAEAVLNEELKPRLDRVELVDVTSDLQELQAYKSELEVEALRRSAIATDRGLQAALDACRPGVTEQQIAGDAARAMYASGAEDIVFLSVVGGPLSGFKHALPRDRPLQNGDMVFLDMGCSVGGYLSDASRCAIVGPGSDEQWEFLRAGERIEDAIFQRMKPGRTIGELAAEGQELAEELGVAQYLYFRGHGIGTSTHVPPSFVPNSTTRLRPGMAYAFEPMLVRKGFGTAVVENVIHMRSDGAESLNQAPKVWRQQDVA